MYRIDRLFLLLTLVGPLHMAEQIVTGVEEFHMIRDLLGSYHALFDPAHTDQASVALITFVWTVVSFAFYALLVGGRARLAVLGGFGVFCVTELHHVVEAVQKGAYDPGLVTCVPYAALGALLVREVWREWRMGQGRALSLLGGGALVPRA